MIKKSDSVGDGSTAEGAVPPDSQLKTRVRRCPQTAMQNLHAQEHSVSVLREREQDKPKCPDAQMRQRSRKNENKTNETLNHVSLAAACCKGMGHRIIPYLPRSTTQYKARSTNGIVSRLSQGGLSSMAMHNTDAAFSSTSGNRHNPNTGIRPPGAMAAQARPRLLIVHAAAAMAAPDVARNFVLLDLRSGP